jgi:hypothetical protein
MRQLSIPPSVRVIDACAFRQCRHLREVIFEPESQWKILRGFRETAVQDISIPSRVTSVAPTGFLHCPDLRSVRFETSTVIPTSVTAVVRRTWRVFVEETLAYLAHSRSVIRSVGHVIRSEAPFYIPFVPGATLRTMWAIREHPRGH